MSKVYLIIAGHGHQRDGSFDPGATGFITKGEYRYMVENLFPLMKKYVPKDAKVIFYDEKKVSNHGNLVQLVNEHKADEVIEFHFDAFTNQARGGHVIIHSDYSPDDMDLRIRDAIGSMVGLRFTHRGHQGISGRSNLFNVNVARNNGITYRLLELGFGTNRTDADIMLQRTDEYAKKLVEAIINAKVEDSKPAKEPAKPLGHSYTVQAGDTLSAIAKKYNTTAAELAKFNELSDPNLIRVGEDIEIPIAVSGPAPQPVVRPSSTPKPAPRPQVTQLAIDGSFGPATTRRLQQVLGTQVTGAIGGQQRTAITENIAAVRFGSGGSMVVREMQRRLNLPSNQRGGLFGPLTLRALQRRMGTPVTGAISRTNSAVVKELQRRLNQNRF
ncbi:N-acetylmuramoyl-L-alanine amidase [Alkalibacterium thalassium]|uniref:N-acetylmuramoyl-L-alanine amidase n=1 Tax=Alkalibacterium thalassium TaxID=426701 RepID=A0A1G8VNK4_9LACT|nr:N-acetylmuramoyl-L-alanine amidase [Alkalibacterium thalassium]SDJ67497.1 N-acetylmuramoyl-L-alanine amidase [Alkalibacterium thalassium]